MKWTAPQLAFLALAGFALLEVASLEWRTRAVAKPADWQAAAAHIRGQLQPRDLIVAAPDWADPLLRLHLGDQIPLPMAGRSDTARYTRLWALSLRGARPASAPAGPPSQRVSFGQVEVLRWDLGQSPVLYDFAEHIAQAQVTLGASACRLTQQPLARGGRLGRGSLPPQQRFVCDSRRPWLYVGPTVLEDLALTPRHCVWQHPAGTTPLTVRFADVPLGDRIVFYSGLYYEDERMREHGPVHARILVDGEVRASLVHRDGDGWVRHVVDTGAGAGRGELAVEVTAPRPHKRSFCWTASSRRGPQR